MTRRSPRFLDKGMRGWLVTMARKNYWRVAAWMDLDDLIAEGFLAYAICRAKYDDRVANKRHFMALVQITFINQITDLANDRTAQPEIAASQLGNPDDPEGDPFESWLGGMDGDQELCALLSTAPIEIRRLLQLAGSPEWADIMSKPLRRRPGGGRETIYERLSRLVGLPEGGLDIQERVRRLLAGETPDPQFILISHPARGVIRSWRAA